MECNGLEGQIPASLAEFTLNGDGGLSYYDISYVDGSNIPLRIIPIDGTFNAAVGNCKEISCTEDQRNLDLQKYNIKMKDANGVFKIIYLKIYFRQFLIKNYFLLIFYSKRLYKNNLIILVN